MLRLLRVNLRNHDRCLPRNHALLESSTSAQVRTNAAKQLAMSREARQRIVDSQVWTALSEHNGLGYPCSSVIR